MTVNLNTKTGGFRSAQTETVDVWRRTQTGSDTNGEPIFAPPVKVYSALVCDFQDRRGQVVEFIGATDEVSDAILLLEPNPYTGILPANILEGDAIVYTAENFLVEFVANRNYPFQHLAALCKQGCSWLA
jgi:hypothetical protein